MNKDSEVEILRFAVWGERRRGFEEAAAGVAGPGLVFEAVPAVAPREGLRKGSTAPAGSGRRTWCWFAGGDSLHSWTPAAAWLLAVLERSVAPRRKAVSVSRSLESGSL